MFIKLTKSKCGTTTYVNLDAIDSVEMRWLDLPEREHGSRRKAVTRLQMRAGTFLDVLQSVDHVLQFLPMAEQLRGLPVREVA